MRRKVSIRGLPFRAESRSSTLGTSAEQEDGALRSAKAFSRVVGAYGALGAALLGVRANADRLLAVAARLAPMPAMRMDIIAWRTEPSTQSRTYLPRTTRRRLGRRRPRSDRSAAPSEAAGNPRLRGRRLRPRVVDGLPRVAVRGSDLPRGRSPRGDVPCALRPSRSMAESQPSERSAARGPSLSPRRCRGSRLRGASGARRSKPLRRRPRRACSSCGPSPLARDATSARVGGGGGRRRRARVRSIAGRRALACPERGVARGLPPPLRRDLPRTPPPVPVASPDFSNPSRSRARRRPRRRRELLRSVLCHLRRTLPLPGHPRTQRRRAPKPGNTPRSTASSTVKFMDGRRRPHLRPPHAPTRSPSTWRSPG